MRNARYIIWFVVDAALKYALGVLLALLVWLPFGVLAGFSARPWLIAGILLGTLINGFFELSDVFGLKKLLHLDD